METTTTIPPTSPLPPASREHIVLTPGVCRGRPRIVNTRIRVQDIVVWHEQQGQTPCEITVQFPQLTLADVHSALAYYHDHQSQIDADLRADDEAFESLRASQPSLLEKIAARRPDVTSLSNAASLAYLRSGVCPAEDVERLRSDLPRRRSLSPCDPELRILEEELNSLQRP